MATKKLPDFLTSVEQNYCLGRLLSCANGLKAEGYKNRHIKFAAVGLMMDIAREGGFAEYTYFHEWLENYLQASRANLEQSAAAYDEAEREGRSEAYLAGL